MTPAPTPATPATTTTTSAESLPFELLESIAVFLPTDAVLDLALVSRRLRTLVAPLLRSPSFVRTNLKAVSQMTRWRGPVSRKMQHVDLLLGAHDHRRNLFARLPVTALAEVVRLRGPNHPTLPQIQYYSACPNLVRIAQIEPTSRIHAKLVRCISAALSRPEHFFHRSGTVELAHRLFLACCRHGMAPLVATMIADNAIDVAFEACASVRLASQYGSHDVLQLVLPLATPRMDASTINESLESACREGNDRVVRTLLALPITDPSCSNNYPIRIACERGHAAIVRLLLDARRADPSVNGNVCARTAVESSNEEIFAMLLNDPRVDVCADDNFCFRRACALGCTSIVRMLLAHPGVDPAALNSVAFQDAAAHGHLAVVGLLLEDPRIDPFPDSSHVALLEAAARGHYGVVSLLLRHRVGRPSVSHGAVWMACREARARGHRDVVNMLSLYDGGAGIGHGSASHV